jgi:hypothetical protein
MDVAIKLPYNANKALYIERPEIEFGSLVKKPSAAPSGLPQGLSVVRNDSGARRRLRRALCSLPSMDARRTISVLGASKFKPPMMWSRTFAMRLR